MALSSRARLARNLIDHPFPGFMDDAEEETVRKEIVSAFSQLSGVGNFTILYLRSMKPIERKILLERNIITEGFSLGQDKAVAVSQDQSVSAMICENDHLRLACIREGLSLRDVYHEVDGIESQLEDLLHFAASLEWGYLGSHLQDVGTGLRASVMVHLPALVMTNLVDKALKAMTEVGLSVKGFFGEGSSSLGNMYQVSNQVSLGMSESGILENLESVTTALIEYERNAREQMLEKDRIPIEDTVFRAWGILTNCRSIASREAMDLLSDLRLGICLEMIDGIPLGKVNQLFFLTQKSHVLKMVENDADGNDTPPVDHFRAKVIRDSLASASGGA